VGVSIAPGRENGGVGGRNDGFAGTGEVEAGDEETLS